MKVVMIDGTPIHTDNVLRVGSRIHGRGQITKTHEQLQPDKSMCGGCRDDFYNHGGHPGCWAFKTAKVVNKVGYSTLNVMNGPDTIMDKTLSCWHAWSK